MAVECMSIKGTSTQPDKNRESCPNLSYKWSFLPGVDRQELISLLNV
jgi:hypothetical protein